MKFGLALPNYGASPSKHEIVELATAAEKLGYDSVWTTDHTIMQSSYAYPYGHILETMVTLGYVAAITKHVLLGTSILSLPLRNPILAAKQTATLDCLSDGRLILGVGVGGGEDDVYEFEYLGADYLHRGEYANESLDVIKNLWSEDHPAYRGSHFTFSDCVFLPKPVQRNPPIWIAGSSMPALKRAASYGNGWHPTGIAPEEYKKCSALIEKMSGGRRIVRSSRYLVRQLSENETATEDAYYSIQGKTDEVIHALDEFKKAGMEHMVCYFGDDGLTKSRDRLERFAREIVPSF